MPDSASSATAILAGVKCQHRTLGVNQDVTYRNCSSVKGNEVQSILSYAHQEGRCSLLPNQERYPYGPDSVVILQLILVANSEGQKFHARGYWPSLEIGLYKGQNEFKCNLSKDEIQNDFKYNLSEDEFQSIIYYDYNDIPSFILS